MYLHSYLWSAFLSQNFTKFFNKAIVKFFSRGINKYLKIISCFIACDKASLCMQQCSNWIPICSSFQEIQSKWRKIFVFVTVGVVLCVLSSRSHSVNQTKRKFGQLVFVNFQQTLFLFDLWILKVCPSFLSRQEINFYVQYKTVECRGSNEWVYKHKSIISCPVRCSEIISRKLIFSVLFTFSSTY